MALEDLVAQVAQVVLAVLAVLAEEVELAEAALLQQHIPHQMAESLQTSTLTILTLPNLLQTQSVNLGNLHTTSCLNNSIAMVLVL